jgi:hypothetical protein
MSETSCGHTVYELCIYIPDKTQGNFIPDKIKNTLLNLFGFRSFAFKGRGLIWRYRICRRCCAIFWFQQTGTRADKKGNTYSCELSYVVHCRSQTILFVIFCLPTWCLKCIWHEISYFLRWKNSLSCSVTYFSVSCFYGLFPRYFNLFDM